MSRLFALLLAISATIAAPMAIVEWLFGAERIVAEAAMRSRTVEKTLRVGTMRHPTTYYTDANNEGAGLEFDLATAFATTQRSAVEWKLFNNERDARFALARGVIDFIAMGLSTSAKNGDEANTTAAYRESSWILLYAPQKVQPSSLLALQPKRVVVSARIFEHPSFREIITKHPAITFAIDAGNDDETLMAAIGDDEIAYAIVEEDTFNTSRHFHYDTQRAFVVHPALSRVWRFRADDAALRDEADRFLQGFGRDGQLTRVLDRYFGFPQSRKQEEFEIFAERVSAVLPRYRKWFHEAQERHGIEWRLLAAISYQESHWRAEATSETGVRGIMQFTEDTARRFGVDRLDPYSSIMGGARYIDDLKKNELSERISEPDKTWLALAAYNIGIGHVENARILTQRNRKNPDSWSDVRRHLPLLAKPEVAAQFKLGRCRCGMPVDFVESVRAYYDVLLRLEAPHQPPLRVQ